MFRSLQCFICAFLAATILAGLLIEMFETSRMPGFVEGIMIMKVSRLPGASADVSAKSGDSSLRIAANAVPPATAQLALGKPSIAVNVLTNGMDFPSRNQQNFMTANLQSEHQVIVPGLEVSRRNDTDPRFNQLGEEAKVRIHHLRPDYPRLVYDDNRQKPPIRSERAVSIVQHPGAIGSNAVFSAGQVAREVNTVSAAQIAKLAETFGTVARERLTHWRALMSSRENRTMPERQKLELVNDFINRTPFKSDREHWGKEDYWATPIEFLSTNGGDCEDFAIAKYFTLRALGVPEEKLQITYVKEVNLYNEAHMVLAYFQGPDAEPLILDNVNRIIQPASARIDLVPVYSFNGSRLWLAKEQGGRSQSEGSSNRLAQWTELQTRMRNVAYPTLHEWMSRNRV